MNDDTDDILSEILEYGDVPIRQPGDIDGYQIISKDPHGRSINWAYYHMQKIAKERDDFVMLVVYDEERHRQIRVLRKIK